MGIFKRFLPLLIVGCVAFALPASAGSTESVKSGAWSDPSVWSTNAVPGNHETVTITNGHTVTYDAYSSNVIDLLTVNGTLTTAKNKNTQLVVDSFVIHGAYEIGTESSPLPSNVNATLILTGAVEQLLSMDDARIDIHGATRAVTWTTLSQRVAKGENMIMLKQAVDWKIGDLIVIASTKVTPEEAEVRKVNSISADGMMITLNEPLEFTHFGEKNEYAEVGLLTHNILVKGDEMNKAGDVKFSGTGTVRIKYARFDQLGTHQAGGKYTLHFHMMKNMEGAYIKGVSVTNSASNCIVIHATDGVLLQDNVAYNTKGHCYYLEDGVEQNNKLIHNLGVLTKPGGTGNTASMPATFMIKNPNNTVEKNAAAGSKAFGFWYFLLSAPTGKSASVDMQQNTLALKSFKQNVSHSNERHGFTMDGHGAGTVFYDPPTVADFTQFTAYQNTLYGVWAKGDQIEFTESVFMDNKVGVTFLGTNSALKHSVIVGDTGRRPEDTPMIIGFEYNAGPNRLFNVHIKKFNTTENQKQKAIAIKEDAEHNLSPLNRYYKVKSFDVAHDDLFYFPEADHNGEKFAILRNGFKGATLTPLLNFHKAAGCKSAKEWNLYVCPKTVYGTLEVFTNRADNPPQDFMLTRLDTGASIGIALEGNSMQGWYVANVSEKGSYRVSHGNKNAMRVLYTGEEGVTVHIPFDTKPSAITEAVSSGEVVWTYDSTTQEVILKVEHGKDYRIAL